MNTTKVLFLDFDGVLNSAEVFKVRGTADCIDRTMVLRVARIVEETGCSVVISSTWRLLHSMGQLKAMLRLNGLPDVVIDKTPSLWHNDGNRGDEIRTWLNANPHVKQFVILDDEADMGDCIDHLVRTSFKTGLQDEHVEQAITILNKP